MLRVVRYLKGTRDLGLFFKSKGAVILHCYVDASYNSSDDAKSQTGYVFTLGDDDAAFYSRSVKQVPVSLSSTEAEYIALCEAATEIVWLRQLLKDMGFPQESATTVFEDNMSCIDMAHGSGNHQRTKHINVRYHYTRELVLNNTIKLVHLSTADMIADILTKALPTDQFTKLRNMILQCYA